MKALVLCAGMGTRLGDLTRETPKVMLPLAGEPLLGHTLRYLARHGCHQVAINLHFRPELIRGYIGDGRRFGVEVTWSHEEELLGTAGAVKNLEGFFSDEPFLVFYGDLVIDHDLHSLMSWHLEREADVTLLLHRRHLKSNSLVRMANDGRVTGFYERPSEKQRGEVTADFEWVNSGVQVLSPTVMGYIPKGRSSDLPGNVYSVFFDRLRIFGLPVHGYRCAIDSPDRYVAANEAIETGLVTRW